MGAWISSESGARFKRHLPEVIAVLVAVGILGATGFVVGVPFWAFVVLLITATALISMAYSRWTDDCTPVELHQRIALQTICVTTLVYATGWGPALGIVHLFTLADNTKHSGSRSARPVLGWAAAATVLAQLAVSAGLVPSQLPSGPANGVALVGLLVLTFVTARVSRMTSAKEEAEASMRSTSERFRSLVRNSSDVIVTIGPDARITYCSPSSLGVLGYPEDALVDLRYLDLVHPEDLDQVITFVRDLLEEPGASGVTESRFRHHEGHFVTIETAARNLLDDPDVASFVLNIRDITARRVLEAELEHQAFHDTLTGLANRSLFRERVRHVISQSTRTHRKYGVLFLDLDGFKDVNDSLGHQSGDKLLIEVARRIEIAIRDEDTAARLGGDEFAVLVEDLNDQSDAARVAERLLTALRAPYRVGDADVVVGASIGIALGDHPDDVDTLLRNADIAMYMAKGAGKGTFEIFEPSMHVAVVERLAMERDLTTALTENQLILHYQPIVQLEDGSITGVEALIRWMHPERGMVSPGDFIPLAEETGLVVPMGAWVLREATRQVAAWQETFPSAPPVTVSVNVSAKQLSAGTLHQDVADALQLSGLQPEHLTLEITETAIVRDPEDAIRQLRELKALGIRVAIDDFGTGYSSLAYLQRFPIDVLKIDRSFIDGMTNGKQNPAVVRAIVALGHSLQLQTVAEGIEHDEQLTQFKALNCQLGQGFFFARPGDHGTIGELLRARAAASPRPAIIDLAVQEGATRR